MPTPLKQFDIVVARAWCTLDEQASVNSFFYYFPNPIVGGCTDADFATEWDSDVGMHYTALLTTAARYNGTQAQIVDRFPTSPLNASTAVTTNAGPGTVSGTTLPRQTCALTSWKTALAGRKYRGRTYWPFPPTGFDTGDGIPTTTAQIFYQDQSIATFAFSSVSVGPNACQQVLYHRGFPKAVPPIPPSFTPMTELAVPLKWATQRRRGSYGRANVSPI